MKKFTNPSYYMEDVAPPTTTNTGSSTIQSKPSSTTSSTTTPPTHNQAPSHVPLNPAKTSSGSNKYGEGWNSGRASQFSNGFNSGPSNGSLWNTVKSTAGSLYNSAKSYGRKAWNGKLGVGYGTNKSNSFGESQAVTKARYDKIIMEYMDTTDPVTVRQAMSLNEAEQNTLLASLTNKLYQMIIGKVSSIDYGDIPNTAGNIRKLPKYKQMRECIEVLHDIFIQYKENTEPVDVLDNAISNLENYSDLFMASYGGEIELGKMVYENATLGVVCSIGYMISVCIEYVKDPKKQGLTIVLKKTGIAKVKEHLVYENVKKFNEACSNGDLEKALRPLIKDKIKNFSPVALVHGALAIGVIAIAILPFLKQLTYFFYSTRVRVSSYFDAQADLLEMNASELKSNKVITTVSDKNTVISRQLKIAELFHKVADKISIDTKQAEIKATNDLKSDNQKFKMDQVESNPANIGAVSEPLF